MNALPKAHYSALNFHNNYENMVRSRNFPALVVLRGNVMITWKHRGYLVASTVAAVLVFGVFDTACTTLSKTSNVCDGLHLKKDAAAKNAYNQYCGNG
ncbi:MAG: hypothetical protein JWM39_888 [Parcubacteria group bacterium]|jgi:hypothetical protein|nr:hypothetical protein [Parcubacteria group bacterium]